MYPPKTVHFLTFWTSKIILKVLPPEILDIFRKLERTSKKLLTAKSHRSFNETCFNNDLLPNYSILYIYIIMQHILPAVYAEKHLLHAIFKVHYGLQLMSSFQHGLNATIQCSMTSMHHSSAP